MSKKKASNLIIDECNDSFRLIMYKLIQHIVKVNLLLMKDVLEP